MRRHIQHTSAIIPPDCRHDQQQSECFGTPEDVESAFYSFYGHMISDDYVLNIQTLLRDIHMAIVDLQNNNAHMAIVDLQNNNAHLHYSMRERRLKCEVARVDLVLRASNCIQLDLILVRPCAQGIGILKMVFWQIIKTCEYLGMSFMIDRPLPKTQAFLKRFGSIVLHDEDRKRAFTAYSNMHYITPEIVNLGDIIILSDGLRPDYELILNPSVFPNADTFNDGIDPAHQRLSVPVSIVNSFVSPLYSDRNRNDWQNILRSRR